MQYNEPLPSTPYADPIPLSFAQQRLWFLHQFEGPSPTYNVPLALRLRGPLDTAALQDALNDLVQRHESLRTVFDAIDGTARQNILNAQTVRLTVAALETTASDLSAALTRAAGHSFDLSREIPIRAGLFQLDPTAHPE